MNVTLLIRLQTTPDQRVRLLDLQSAFADVCNTLAPLVQRTGCWNRVALHHLAYKPLRQQFPAMGSQMICNAIYSVSRACRLVYQHADSPFNLQKLAGKPLPLVKFQHQSPVFFDRHTLSLKDGQVSMYTLDGRMRFNLPLSAEDEHRFRHSKLREIVLLSSEAGLALRFTFGEAGGDEDAPPASAVASGELPEYLLIDNAPPTAPEGPAVTRQMPAWPVGASALAEPPASAAAEHRTAP